MPAPQLSSKEQQLQAEADAQANTPANAQANANTADALLDAQQQRQLPHDTCQAEAKAGVPPGVAPLLPQNLQFDKWVRAMFDVLLDFATMTCSTLAGTSDRAMVRLREMVQRMKLMAQGVGAAEPPAPVVTGQLSTALSVLPQRVAEILRHTFSRVSQLHQQILDVEAAWTQEWLQLHLAMLGTFFGIALRIQHRWSSDVSGITKTMATWEAIVERMMSPQREKLSRRAAEVSQSWLGFCLKYAQMLSESGVDTTEFMNQQQSIVGEASGDVQLHISLTLALEVFLDHCSSQREYAPVPQASAYIEQQQRHVAQLGQLEEDMLQNRKDRHAMWVAVQHQNTQPDVVTRIQRLDDAYAEQQREAKLVQNLLQEQHAEPAQPELPAAPSDTAAKAWHEQAERFRPIVQQLERQILRYQSMAKLLQRTIYEVHDEVLVTTLTEVCARLQKVKQEGLRKMEATIQIRSAQVTAQTQQLHQQLEVLLQESSSSSYGAAHEIAVSEIHTIHCRARDSAEQAAKLEARQSSVRLLQQFVQDNAALQAMLARGTS